MSLGEEKRKKLTYENNGHVSFLKTSFLKPTLVPKKKEEKRS